MRLLLLAALNVAVGPTRALSQSRSPDQGAVLQQRLTAAAQEPRGVRQLRGYTIRDRTSYAVNATNDGFVEFAFAPVSESQPVHPVSGFPAREFFLAEEVLEWVNDVEGVIAWLLQESSTQIAPVAVLGPAAGGQMMARAALTTAGKREAWIELRPCGGPSHGRTPDIGASGLEKWATMFRRAAHEARAATGPRPSDQTLWFGHAVSCPARPAFENVDPSYPEVPDSELRPHEELVQFVVDATGRVEPGSERFLPSSSPAFAASIRKALRTWRFTPASRGGRAVRQLAHQSFGFIPPAVADADRRPLCPSVASRGIEARAVSASGVQAREDSGGRSGATDTDFLRRIVHAFYPLVIADSLPGVTLRISYGGDKLAARVTMLQDGVVVPLDGGRKVAVDWALPTLPDIPGAARSGDSAHVEVSFRPRCDVTFLTTDRFNAGSVYPQSNGLLRLAGEVLPDGFHAFREGRYRERQEVIPAIALLRFVDSVAALMPHLDTAVSNRNHPERMYARDTPRLGSERDQGVSMWLTDYGAVQAGITCGYTNSRFLEVSPSNFSEFRRAVSAAVRLMPVQPRWAPREDLPFGEHEVSCGAGLPSENLPPTAGGELDSMSREILLRVLVDRDGRVEPGSVEFISGSEPTVTRRVRTAVEAWQFVPAMVGGATVRAQRHFQLVLRPPHGDAMALAAQPFLRQPEDTIRRTVFSRPSVERLRPRYSGMAVSPQGLLAMQPMIDRARLSWPAVRERYVNGPPPAGRLEVMVRLTDATGRVELAWVAVSGVGSGKMDGTLVSDVVAVSGWRRGDRLAVREDTMLDWAVLSPFGTTEGDFTARFLDRLWIQR